MGDVSIAQDLLDGVVDAMADLGTTRTLRLITVDPVNPLDPGASPVETNEDVSIEALLFGFDKRYMPEANITEGEVMSILSIDPLTDAQVAAITPGNILIDGSRNYEIVKAQPIEAAGIIVTVIVQLKG